MGVAETAQVLQGAGPPHQHPAGELERPRVVAAWATTRNRTFISSTTCSAPSSALNGVSGHIIGGFHFGSFRIARRNKACFEFLLEGFCFLFQSP